MSDRLDAQGEKWNKAGGITAAALVVSGILCTFAQRRCARDDLSAPLGSGIFGK